MRGKRCICQIYPETPSYPMFGGGRKPEWEKQDWKAIRGVGLVEGEWHEAGLQLRYCKG